VFAILYRKEQDSTKAVKQNGVMRTAFEFEIHANFCGLGRYPQATDAKQAGKTGDGASRLYHQIHAGLLTVRPN
jgi:hypothetical protein